MYQLFFKTNPYMKFHDDISNSNGWTDTQTSQNHYALTLFESEQHRIVNTCLIIPQFYSIGVVLMGRNYMGMHVSMMNRKYLAFWIEMLAFIKMKEI